MEAVQRESEKFFSSKAPQEKIDEKGVTFSSIRQDPVAGSEIKSQVEINTAIACICAAAATAPRTKAAKAARHAQRLTKQRRRKAADWWREVDVVKQILEIN